MLHSDAFDDDVLPPYSSAGAMQAPPYRMDGPQISSLFSNHLAGLRSQIAAEQAARSTVREAHDSPVLLLLVSYVEELFSSIVTMDPPPSLVEATMVPQAAISDSWEVVDAEKRRGEVRMVIKVGRESKSSSDKKNESSDPQPSTALWWSDEAMGRRLARVLQPQRPPATGREARQPADQRDQGPGSRDSFWGRFKKGESATQSKPLQTSSSRLQRPEFDGVSMSVKAEEVTFRAENEFGIWETHSGWGIVLRVQIRPV